MAGYLLAGDRSDFVHTKGASLSLIDCQYYLSPLYTHKENWLDKIPFYPLPTIFYVDPIGRQTNSFATKTACHSEQNNVIALDLMEMIFIF